MPTSEHWACKVFANQQGKKILDILVDNAHKREANSKLLEMVDCGLQGLLGLSFIFILQSHDYDYDYTISQYL